MSVLDTVTARYRAALEKFVGKFIDLTDNTLTGTTAQFNAALSDGDFVVQGGSLEVGHASDTTVSRSAAGVIAVEGFNVITKTVIPLATTATLAAIAAREYIYLLASGAVPTLPTAVGNLSIYQLKNVDTAAISIATTSSQTIDGVAAPLVLQPKDAYTLVSDNANWVIL